MIWQRILYFYTSRDSFGGGRRLKSVSPSLSALIVLAGPRWDKRLDALANLSLQALEPGAWSLEARRFPRQRQTRQEAWNVTSQPCAANNPPPFTEFTPLTGDPVCSRNKDYIRELKVLFSPYPTVTNTHTATREMDTLCARVHDLTFAKRRPILFPVLPSPAVMVQRRPQLWSQRGM